MRHKVMFVLCIIAVPLGFGAMCLGVDCPSGLLAIGLIIAGGILAILATPVACVQHYRGWEEPCAP